MRTLSPLLLLVFGCPSLQDALDGDRDGYSPAEGDCDDSVQATHPGARERPNANDDDCDDIIDEETSNQDLDLDHFSDSGYGGPDCDDNDPQINPDAQEICSDGIDNNCNSSPDTCVFSGQQSLTTVDGWWAGTTGAALGSSITSVGDVTGDDRPDMAVGGPGVGSVEIISLPSGAEEGESDAQVYTLSTTVPGLGFAVAGVLDVNGDEIPDLAASSIADPAEAGSLVLFFGPVTADGASDELWFGSVAGRQGQALSGGADLDDDGGLDLVSGQPLVDGETSDGGVVYLWSGATMTQTEGASSAPVTLFRGSPYDQAGSALATADWNGDGLADLAIGAPSSRSDLSDPSAQSTGTVAILYGGPELGFGEAEADAWLAGVDGQERAGQAVVAPGDRDGDGYADLAVGSPFADPAESENAGAVYEVTGPLHGVIPLESAIATWEGAAADERAGEAIGAPGDMDGDGNPELAIGAPGATAYARAEAGRTYLISGPNEEGHRNLSSASASWGGPGLDAVSGSALAGVGDLNLDGYFDLCIGAPGWDLGEGTDPAGAAFLVLGRGI